MDIKTEDKMRLLDIADAIREIQGYLGGADYEEFNIREDVREAVSAQMVMIGGAAALLSDEFKEQYGDIDWEMLKGLQYAHYDEELELDHHPMLHIAKNDLPEIMNDILDVATMLEDEDDLEDVSLNEEDKHDIESLQEDRKLRTNTKAEEVFTDEDMDEDRGREDSETEDDSYIDKRFEDEDVTETSSLDDNPEDEEQDNPKT